MKKTLIFTFAALVMLQSPIFAKSKKHHIQEMLEAPVERTIPLTELTAEMSKQILLGTSSNIAIECKEGTELPIKYLLRNRFFSMHYSPNLSFKVEKSFYIRVINNKSFLSYDLIKWEKPKRGLLESNMEISADKSHLLLETTENLSYEINQL